MVNPLRAKFIKWSNTLKQFVGKLTTNCLSVFDHFAGLALNGLIPDVLSVFLVYSCYCNIFNSVEIYVIIYDRRKYIYIKYKIDIVYIIYIVYYYI